MICEGKQYQTGKSVTFDSISERNSTREKKKRSQNPMKKKPNKAKEEKAESIPDQEHDEKKDLSFFRFPSSVKKEREEYGHYEQPNY